VRELALSSRVVSRVLGVCPGSPFIVSRGHRVLHVLTGDLLFLNGKVTVPTLWKLAHLVLGAWLAAWLLLWRVAEPC